MGCSVPDLADLYANCEVTSGVVTTVVNEKCIKFNATSLDEILRISAKGFSMYVWEDKSMLGAARLLELAQKLSQQPSLKAPQSIKKGEMTSLHQLLFWFIIKNIIPRRQGRNLANAMDQCFIDLLDREEKINLPAIMVRHIARIANTTREHDLGYGFLLTLVFEGVAL